MSAQKLITEHLDLWTGAIAKKSSSGRGSNKKIDLIGLKGLRKLVLGMAVQGKLTDREQSDEPASKLVRRIVENQEIMYAEGTVRKRQKLLGVSQEEQTFHLPSNWEWVRLGTLFDSIISGGTPSKRNSQFWNGDIPWASVKDLGKSKYIDKTQDYITEKGLKAGSKLADAGDVLICTRMGLGKVAICSKPIAINQDLKAVKVSPEVSLDYFFLAYTTLEISGTGTTVAGITQDKLLDYVIGLPPIQEQHRIVQKVDELMALCDRLEQQTSDQLEAHETLVDTLLGTLTQSENATDLADNWARLAAHFDTLFTTEQSIEKLKQTILQLAVMGFLVTQNINSESSVELIEAIDMRKSELEKKGLIKASKPLPDIAPDELPRVVPDSWTVVRLGRIALQVTDGTHHTPTYVPSGVPFLSVKDMSAGVLDFSDTRYISEEEHKELSRRCAPELGDLLITKVGSTGIPVLVNVDREFSIFVSVALVKIPSDLIDGRFLRLLVASPWVRRQSEEGTEGIGNKNLVLRKIRNFVLPIPPADEQARIIQKVDELMALCDQLKERLNQASETHCQLADAIVEGALH